VWTVLGLVVQNKNKTNSYVLKERRDSHFKHRMKKKTWVHNKLHLWKSVPLLCSPLRLLSIMYISVHQQPRGRRAHMHTNAYQQCPQWNDSLTLPLKTLIRNNTRIYFTVHIYFICLISHNNMANLGVSWLTVMPLNLEVPGLHPGPKTGCICWNFS
jgi:hypothetical protein